MGVFFQPVILGLKNIHHAMNAHLCVWRVPDFQVEVQLDSQKHKQKGAVKRALFLDSQQPLLQKIVRVRRGDRVCNHNKIYLRVSPMCSFHSFIPCIKPYLTVTPENGVFWLQGEKDFRDKLSPIFVALNISLDPKAAADSHSLRPILNYQTTNVIEQKVFWFDLQFVQLSVQQSCVTQGV